MENHDPTTRADRSQVAESAGRVLVIANRIPYPLDDGWKRRTFHLVRSMAKCRPVTLVSLHDGDARALEALNGALGGDVRIVVVRQAGWVRYAAMLLGLCTPIPFHVWRQRSRSLRRAIRRLARDTPFDVAVATLFHLFPYLRDLPAGTRRFVDTHNIDSLVLRRYSSELFGPVRGAYARLTARKLERSESRALAGADCVWVCSEQERARLAERAPAARIEVIPNGVDTAPQIRSAPASPNRLLFFGRLDYYPNTDAVIHFATAILPAIRAIRPDVEFRVVGPGARAELHALARHVPGLRLEGRVEQLENEIAAASLVVVPLRAGGGTRLKILEALALGRPVVSTTQGAEGLELAAGRDLLIADGPDAFASAVLQVMADPALALRLGATGRESVRRRYDWDRIGHRVIASLARAPGIEHTDAGSTVPRGPG